MYDVMLCTAVENIMGLPHRVSVEQPVRFSTSSFYSVLTIEIPCRISSNFLSQRIERV